MTPGCFSLTLTKETLRVSAQFLAGWRVCSMLLLVNKIILGRDLWQTPPRTKQQSHRRRMCLKTLNMYEKIPRTALLYQLNMRTWLSIMEDCTKAFITHVIISKQQTYDWALGGTKQEVQTYATAAALLKPSDSSGNARALLPWKLHSDGERLLAKKDSSVDHGRGKNHPYWRPAWPWGSAQVRLV